VLPGEGEILSLFSLETGEGDALDALDLEAGLFLGCAGDFLGVTV